MVERTLTERIVAHILVHYVSVFLVLITATFRIIKFLFYPFISKVVQTQYSESEHKENVQKVQNQVKRWNEGGRKSKMCTGRPGWKTTCNRIPIYKDTLTRIHINLNRLIKIKTDQNENGQNVVFVEPLMTMGELIRELGSHGWTLPVVPEVESLTVGGLICGIGLETSSHKHGLFHHTCISYEVVVASGEIIKCTQDENSDLFYSLPGSHGTLGFLTGVEIQIIPAKSHVKLEYIPVHSLDEAVSTFEAQVGRMDEGNEFVEGIMFSLNSGVIMVGQSISAIQKGQGKVNKLGQWWKPWFYKHVESFLQPNRKGRVEFIPLKDYYHRHTRCLFWIYANFVPYGNTWLFRYLFGWTLPPRIDLMKLLCPKVILDLFDSTHLIQDFAIPLQHLKDGLILSDQVMGVYPVWLCPAKLKNIPSAARFIGNEDEMYVDIGIYGISPLKEYDIKESARKWEMFCLEHRGYQGLYSDVFLSRKEFEHMFKLDLYNKVRKQYGCEDAFPDIYEKVCRAARR